MSVAVIPMAKELGWSAMERGLVSSAFFWGYALTQIPAGWVSTRCAAADGPRLCCCCRRRTLLRLLLLMAPASAAPVIWARRAFLSAAASFLTPARPALPPVPLPALPQHRRRAGAVRWRGAVVSGHPGGAPRSQAWTGCLVCHAPVCGPGRGPGTQLSHKRHGTHHPRVREHSSCSNRSQPAGGASW